MAQAAKIVDLAEVRRQRQRIAPPAPCSEAAAPPVIWVPVWMMVPVWRVI